MAIWAYTGLPGSGKSLHMASLLRSCLGRHPVPCIGNFTLADNAPVRNLDYYHYYPNEQITPSLLFDFAEDWWAKHPNDWHENALMLCLDEMQLVINARSWQKTSQGLGEEVTWLDFFSQHRKLGYLVVLCAQSLGMIDKQVRDNVEYECYHRKLASFGLTGAAVSALVPGGLFVRIVDYPQTRQHLYTEFYRGKKKDFEMYDTRTTFSPVRQGRETGTDGR